jgi:hypothetical protein
MGIVHSGIAKADSCAWRHCRVDSFDCVGGDEMKPEWSSKNGTRYYASAIIEQDFSFFRAGYLDGLEARGKG